MSLGVTRGVVEVFKGVSGRCIYSIHPVGLRRCHRFCRGLPGVFNRASFRGLDGIHDRFRGVSEDFEEF